MASADRRVSHREKCVQVKAMALRQEELIDSAINLSEETHQMAAANAEQAEGKDDPDSRAASSVVPSPAAGGGDFASIEDLAPIDVPIEQIANTVPLTLDASACPPKGAMLPTDILSGTPVYSMVPREVLEDVAEVLQDKWKDLSELRPERFTPVKSARITQSTMSFKRLTAAGMQSQNGGIIARESQLPMQCLSESQIVLCQKRCQRSILVFSLAETVLVPPHSARNAGLRVHGEPCADVGGGGENVWYPGRKCDTVCASAILRDHGVHEPGPGKAPTQEV